MPKLMLLGDEALAQGALDAGISGFYGYPGTPSTEIIEYVQRSVNRLLNTTFIALGVPTRKPLWKRLSACLMPENVPWS